MAAIKSEWIHSRRPARYKDESFFSARFFSKPLQRDNIRSILSGVVYRQFVIHLRFTDSRCIFWTTQCSHMPTMFLIRVFYDTYINFYVYYTFIYPTTRDSSVQNSLIFIHPRIETQSQNKISVVTTKINFTFTQILKIKELVEWGYTSGVIVHKLVLARLRLSLLTT